MEKSIVSTVDSCFGAEKPQSGLAYTQHPNYPSTPDSGTALSEAAGSENQFEGRAKHCIRDLAFVQGGCKSTPNPNSRTHHNISRSPLQVRWLGFSC